MTLLAKTKNFCDMHDLLSADAVLIALSGGPDSMCLLHVLIKLMPTNRIRTQLYAAHVHHGLRNEKADADEQFVRDVCERMGIGLFVKRADTKARAKKQKEGIEQAGRDIRYAFFEQTRQTLQKKHPTVVVALGHHREDQAETVLMHLFRGCGLDGLVGMRPKTGHVIRPLLFAPKQAIDAYLKAENIVYRVDESNLLRCFSRNRWRHDVLPLLREVAGVDPGDKIWQTSGLLFEDQTLLANISSDVFAATCQRIDDLLGLPCKKLRMQPTPIANRMLRLLYRVNFSEVKDLSFEHIRQLQELSTSGGGKKLMLPQMRMAFIFSDMLYLCKANDYPRAVQCLWEAKFGSLPLLPKPMQNALSLDVKQKKMPRKIYIKDADYCLKIVRVENTQQLVYNSRAWFCSKHMLADAELRTRRHGDVISLDGGRTHKLLRRYMTDIKLPEALRDQVPVIASGKDVLWLPGILVAKGYHMQPHPTDEPIFMVEWRQDKQEA